MPRFGTYSAVRDIKVHALSSRDRFIPPTEQQIETMAKSFKQNGQLAPILVTPVTRNTYRVVYGATRYAAARRLHMDKILCIVMHGTALECRINELTENLDRKSLTGAQRKMVRAERRKLIAEHIRSAVPSVGGRGNKGGVRQAARELGVPNSTAQDAVKVTGNSQSRSVSARRKDQCQRSINASPEEWEAFKLKAAAEGKPAAEKLGELVREFIRAPASVAPSPTIKHSDARH